MYECTNSQIGGCESYGYSKKLSADRATSKQLPFRKTVSTTWQDPFLNESRTRKANKVQVQAANVRRKQRWLKSTKIKNNKNERRKS